MAVHSRAIEWSAFAASANVSLQTCVTSAEQHAIQARHYASGFLQGGLSALADAILSSDAVRQVNASQQRYLEQDQGVQTVDDKSIAFVFESKPKNLSYAAEGVDLLLVLSAFDANIKVFFKSDGLANLINVNNSEAPKYTKRFLALTDFDIDSVYCVNDGIGTNVEIDSSAIIDKMSAHNLNAEFIDANALMSALDKTHHVLYF